MYGSPRRRAEKFLFGSGMPATLILIAANVLTFLLGFFSGGWNGGGPLRWLVFSSATFPEFFWTVITWPLVASPVDLIGVLFGALWAYWIGGSLERSWGTRPYLIFLIATSALTALTLWLGGQLLGRPVVAQGIWLAIAAPTIAWCVLNAREVIRFYGIIPVPAPILAWLTVAFTWFQISVGRGHPLLGAFALSGCAAAYWYAKTGRYRGYAAPSSRFGGVARDSRPPLRFHDFDRDPTPRDGWSVKRWMEERKQRRALEQLWKRSNLPDDEQNKRGR